MHTMPAFENENNFQNYSICHSNIFEIELIDFFQISDTLITLIQLSKYIVNKIFFNFFPEMIILVPLSIPNKVYRYKHRQADEAKSRNVRFVIQLKLT